MVKMSFFMSFFLLFCPKSSDAVAMATEVELNELALDFLGAQWLSGRVLDSRPKGRGFEPHRRHCVVVLEQDTFILA